MSNPVRDDGLCWASDPMGNETCGVFGGHEVVYSADDEKRYIKHIGDSAAWLEPADEEKDMGEQERTYQVTMRTGVRTVKATRFKIDEERHLVFFDHTRLVAAFSVWSAVTEVQEDQA